MVSGTQSSSRRPSLHTVIPTVVLPEVYSDARTHGPQGPSRHVRISRAATFGGGSIAMGEDRTRCVVAGKETLRILRVSDPNTAVSNTDHKTITGRGGYRLDASRNFWSGSGLKIDSTSTDVVWGHGIFSNKILTSARNGELIMWDLNKSGPSKYESRVRDHFRSIHKLAYSYVLQYYCISISADGDLRLWDLRDFKKSMLKIHHPTSVRSVVASPVPWQPKHVVTGLDNGSIYRWDLNMGQRGQLDRIPVAHKGPILALDWTYPSSCTLNARTAPVPSQASTAWYGGVGGGLFDDLGAFGAANANANTVNEAGGMGWIASGGLDRCVKVWDLTTPAGDPHLSKHPTYTLHTSFPVRRVIWRPGVAYECELAVVSNTEFAASGPVDSASPSVLSSPHMSSTALPSIVDPHHSQFQGLGPEDPRQNHSLHSPSGKNEMGDPVEVWDVRRGYVAKWLVRGSAVEGGVTDVAFPDPYSMWAQHVSGSFSQFDMRQTARPIDAMPRFAATWDAAGSLAFVADKPKKFEIPYDDLSPERRHTILERKGKVKALGDRSQYPTTQTIGMVSSVGLMDNVDTFAKLAQGYIFEGGERTSICVHNAEVALDAEKPHAAQAWLLLESLLTDFIGTKSESTTPPLSPLAFAHPGLPHSTSAPADIDPHIVSSSPTASRRFSGSPASESRISLEKFSQGGYLSPQRITPSSSTASSPHKLSNATLPPPPAAIFARRGSNPGLTGGISSGPSTPQLQTPRPRIFSSSQHSSGSYRRPSFTTSSIYSVSALSEDTSESSMRSSGNANTALSAVVASLNLKNVGEGALSDSDDDDEDDGSRERGEVGSGEGSEGSMVVRSDDEDVVFDSTYNGQHQEIHSSSSSMTAAAISANLRPAVSPYLYPRPSGSNSGGIPITAHLHPNPSPLSRVAGQQTWTEDEDEENNINRGGRHQDRDRDRDDDSDDSVSPASSSEDETDSLSSSDDNEDGLYTNISGKQRRSSSNVVTSFSISRRSSKSTGSSHSRKSGGDGGGNNRKRRKSSGTGTHSHSRTHSTRSRSSTVASYVASSSSPSTAVIGATSLVQSPTSTNFDSTSTSTSTSLRPPKLTKQESQSSIRTVTAINSPIPDSDKSSTKGGGGGGRLQRDDTIKDLSSSFTFGTSGTSVKGDTVMAKGRPTTPSSIKHPHHQHHKRIRSALSTEFTLDGVSSSKVSRKSFGEDSIGVGIGAFSRHLASASGSGSGGVSSGYEEERKKEVEGRVRDVGWEAMRETLEVFADEGDVQMCTMLALIASEELKVSKSRLVRFLESYIEILVRLRLHTTAAYMRKFSPAEEVRNTTSLETTFYTSCGKCNKPILRPATARALTTTPTSSTVPLQGGTEQQRKEIGTLNKLRHKSGKKPNGSYGFCVSCKKSSATCSICHLPVRGLLFKCPICMHGGHSKCYQAYYTNPNQPRIPLPIYTGSGAISSATIVPLDRGRTTSLRSINTNEDIIGGDEDVGSGDDKGGSNGGSGGGTLGGGGGSSTDVGGSEGVVGYPCAAGCGHFCWAASSSSHTHTMHEHLIQGGLDHNNIGTQFA
ncbi:GATOR2 complex protein WDR24 [Abortiporus biennis]